MKVSTTSDQQASKGLLTFFLILILNFAIHILLCLVCLLFIVGFLDQRASMIEIVLSP